MLYGYYGPEEYERLTSTYADPNSFQYSPVPGKSKVSNPSSIAFKYKGVERLD
jgi:hypothetical protein